jgi:hypothetical protein
MTGVHSSVGATTLQRCIILVELVQSALQRRLAAESTRGERRVM